MTNILPQPLIPNPQSLTLPGVPSGAVALALAELLAQKKNLVHVAVNDRALTSLAEALAFFAPGAEILTFPAWDCMPYDRVSPAVALMSARLRTLATLAGEKSTRPCIVLTTANAIIQRLPPRDAMRHASVTLKTGQSIGRDALAQMLQRQGYRRTGKAMEPGEFALRGGIVDIAPPGMNEGLRIDLFGDDIESIRRFDLLTQRTQAAAGEIALHPSSEVLLSEDSVTRFRDAYRDAFGVMRDDPLYETISQGTSFPGMEHWLPLFYEHTETLFDYCENALFTLDGEAEAAIAERQESILDYYQARVQARNAKAVGTPYNPLPPERAFLMPADWELVLSAHERAHFTPFLTSPSSLRGGEMLYRPVMRFAPPQEGRTPFDQLKETVDAAKKSTLLACFSTGSRERLQTLLMERGFHCITVAHWREMKDVRGKSIGLAVLPLESGFETDKALVLSEQDVLGERITRTRSRRKTPTAFLAEAATLNEGELVVHREHGIGRFEGLVALTVSGAAHDCLKLVYADNDRLFLPVENIEMVSRFGLEEKGTQLDKLGGAAWQSRKARLKERIKIAAEALLKTAAERQLKTAAAIDAPTGSYEEFCARFPYVETEDQARAIEDVLEDLRAGKPMDRLVCGDVGFGKTEVALRAAFAVAMGGAECRVQGAEQNKKLSTLHSALGTGHSLQVALICPTTLLARQHFRNFKERFSGFPVTVRQLSRMVPAREQKETRENLKTGGVDIVIGTHALLSKQTDFKNLGLLIVDEEQHFGVGQKEKLKELKSDVHVLTLSATPIPRTLQMALTGVRSLSLIATPPVDRLAVRSFVMPFDPVVLREAILREMHRGGRVFAVCPRIKDIGEFKAQLTAVAPEAKVAVAHGQMAAGALDEVMNDFYDGKYDILLSTAIIESGLDIPSANTIIIHHAHMFGLSQLYQLRGRVGRAKARAYAYFLLPPYRDLTRNATKRLEVMQTLDSLGAGFTLASHDMDLRGFGNLVGEEQSGHIREVGIELYQQMLEEAVASLKSQVASHKSQVEESPACNLQLATYNSDWSPSLNLGLSVLIPESYVDDLQLRLGLYRRVAGLTADAEIDSFAAELVDRFGKMPEEVAHLIATLGIKLLCKQAGIERIDIGPKGAVISFRGNSFANPEALLAHIGKNARTLRARPDQKLLFTHEWKNDADRLTTVKKLAGEIAGLAA